MCVCVCVCVLYVLYVCMYVCMYVKTIDGLDGTRITNITQKRLEPLGALRIMDETAP